MKALLAAGADPNTRFDPNANLLTPPDETRSDEFITPLVLVAALRWYPDRPEVVTALLAAGADPNVSDGYGISALHHAADSSELVGLLLAAGAAADARTDYGSTPLHFAASHGDRESVRALVGAGADPDARDLQGNTPLHEWAGSELDQAVALPGGAFRFREPMGIAGALLDAGAEATARNAMGETPWEVLQENVTLSVVKGSDDYWRLNDARFSSAPREEPGQPDAP